MRRACSFRFITACLLHYLAVIITVSMRVAGEYPEPDREQIAGIASVGGNAFDIYVIHINTSRL